MTFTVTAALDAWIERQDEPRVPDGKWHPSGLWGCMRKAIYEIRGVPETDPRTPINRRVLFIGHQFHGWLQEAIGQDPLVKTCWVEVPILDDDLNIAGSADSLREMVDGTFEMDEIKTIKCTGLEWGRKKKDLPKADHMGQARTYADSLRRHGSPELGIGPLGNKLQRIRFTYISKDTGDTEEIIVDLPPEGDQGMVALRVMDLEVYRKDPDSLPPRMPLSRGKKSYMCEWAGGRCTFYTKCWDEDPAERAPMGVEF